jgi:endonuclease/exonuclease/phosphatase family metal-dependent hydrolase
VLHGAATLARVRLRVLVYNVKGFRFGVDRVAAVLGEHEPDVAMLNECGTGRKLGRLARAAEMDAAAPRLWPLIRTVRNAVLVRPPWRLVAFHLHRFERSKPFHPRGALVAQVGRTGFRVSALSVHLGLSPQERRRHAEELTDLTLALPGPFLVGGDLNEGPEGKSAGWIAARMWDAWAAGGGTGASGASASRGSGLRTSDSRSSGGATYPSELPTARIDYLFASEHFYVLDAEVPDGPDAREASDHLPLVVDVELREQGPAAR